MVQPMVRLFFVHRKRFQEISFMKQICVIGAGYLGLVTAACFAELGNRVIALDIIEGKIAGLRRGEMPI